MRFAWSGSGFVANVAGSRISVALQTEGATASAFFQPVIDGQVGGRFQVPAGPPQTVVLGTGLAAGDHVVELYRESEGSFGDTVFRGFVDGTLKGAPPPPPRLIEVIGDSISAGYGNLGNETHAPSGTTNACPFTLDTESAYRSYASMVGRALGAEVSIVARSGWGVIRGYDGKTSDVLPSLYANTLGAAPAPAWSFERKADVVVVNLGSNDSSHPAGGDPGAAFETAYVAFLRTVRGHYANAWIFLDDRSDDGRAAPDGDAYAPDQRRRRDGRRQGHDDRPAAPGRGDDRLRLPPERGRASDDGRPRDGGDSREARMVTRGVAPAAADVKRGGRRETT